MGVSGLMCRRCLWNMRCAYIAGSNQGKRLSLELVHASCSVAGGSKAKRALRYPYPALVDYHVYHIVRYTSSIESTSAPSIADETVTRLCICVRPQALLLIGLCLLSELLPLGTLWLSSWLKG
jgi:hypothetical protein